VLDSVITFDADKLGQVRQDFIEISETLRGA
jgi:hypothetical protein